MRTLFEDLSLDTLTPCQNILKNDSPEIRAAKCGDTIVIYLPVNTKLCLNGDFSGCQVRAYDLTARRTAYMTPTLQVDTTLLPMHTFEQDAVIVIR